MLDESAIPGMPDGFSSSILNPENLKKLAITQMPFGKYKGRLVIDLPEAYLLWFVKKEAFPKGKLGDLMQLSLELHIHGLTGLIQPLKKKAIRIEPFTLCLQCQQ